MHLVRKRCVASTLVATALATWASVASAQNFLEDFYRQAGGSANVTAAALYRSADSNTLWFGSAVLRAPRDEFRPFYVTPPRLRAGCGGIDVMLGGFSLPSRAEFVAFLRNIGQNLPGLAFQLALQSLSPTLEGKLAEYKDMLMRYASWSIDSCEAAQALLHKGAEWMRSWSESTTNEQRAAGACSDQAECKERFRANGGAVADSCRTFAFGDDGSPAESCEMNVTWSALRGGQMARLTNDMREQLMSAIGTVVFRRQGQGEDTTLVPVAFPAAWTDIVPLLEGGTQLMVYRCDEPTRCLNPSLQPYGTAGLRQIVRSIAERYVDAVVNRRARTAAGAPSDEDIVLLGMTSVPALRLLNFAGSARVDVGQRAAIVASVSEVVAVEIAAAVLDSMLRTLAQAGFGRAKSALNTEIRDEAERMLNRIAQQRELVMRAREQAIENFRRLADYVVLIDHLDRAFRAILGAQLAANLRFAGR